MLHQHNYKFFIKLLLLILLQKHYTSTKAEFYSSIHEMSKLVQYEHDFLQYMQKFVSDNENKLQYLKDRLSEFERDRDDDEALLGDSPVNRYLLLKRLTIDWERIENLIQHDSGKKSLKKVHKYKSRHVLPNDAELDGAIDGFLRLQDIYRLKTKDMAAGILDRVKYATELEARHCFDIGKRAVQESSKLKLGHSWLMEALERLRVKNDGVNKFVSLEEPLEEVDILAVLAETKHKLGDISGANETYAQLIQLQPANEAFAKNYAMFMEGTVNIATKEIDYNEEHKEIPQDFTTLNEEERYKLTCSGHIKQNPREERDLRCGYMSETHEFLTIAPLKVEELNLDPLLVVYYDVISEKEISIVKELSSKKITRATVMSHNGSVVSPVRTSQFNFIPKTKHPVLEAIDRRVEDMTNLNMIYAEDHQFANYGIGGHYAQHQDWFTPEAMAQTSSLDEMGNRIATVLFYLTDVEQGGGTAFPYLKRLLMPLKGSAAFWYNLHASGEPDVRALHGACPIIVGSKWVQNRWIRENIQSDRRPCEMYNDKVHLY